MNWSHLNSDAPKHQLTTQPKQFHKDKNPSQSEPRQQLKLQSCEKVRHNFTHDPINHTPHTNKTLHDEQREILSFGTHQELVLHKETQRLANLLASICTLPDSTNEQLSTMKELVQNFGRELQQLLDKYLQKFNVFSLPREKKEDFNKKVVLYIDETMKRKFISIGNPTPERSQTIRDLSNHSHDSNQSGKPGKSLNNSRTERISNFQHEQQSHKNSMSKIQSSFNQVNRLLEKVTQPRFVRKTNLLTSRQSRGQSSSIQSLIQRSVEQRKRLHTNNSNSKQTLYAINRLLNE